MFNLGLSHLSTWLIALTHKQIWKRWRGKERKRKKIREKEKEQKKEGKKFLQVSNRTDWEIRFCCIKEGTFSPTFFSDFRHQGFPKQNGMRQKEWEKERVRVREWERKRPNVNSSEKIERSCNLKAFLGSLKSSLFLSFLSFFLFSLSFQIQEGLIVQEGSTSGLKELEREQFFQSKKRGLWVKISSISLSSRSTEITQIPSLFNPSGFDWQGRESSLFLSLSLLDRYQTKSKRQRILWSTRWQIHYFWFQPGKKLSRRKRKKEWKKKEKDMSHSSKYIPPPFHMSLMKIWVWRSYQRVFRSN